MPAALFQLTSVSLHQVNGLRIHCIVIQHEAANQQETARLIVLRAKKKMNLCLNYRRKIKINQAQKNARFVFG